MNYNFFMNPFKAFSEMFKLIGNKDYDSLAIVLVTKKDKDVDTYLYGDKELLDMMTNEIDD